MLSLTRQMKISGPAILHTFALDAGTRLAGLSPSPPSYERAMRGYLPPAAESMLLPSPWLLGHRRAVHREKQGVDRCVRWVTVPWRSLYQSHVGPRESELRHGKGRRYLCIKAHQSRQRTSHGLRVDAEFQLERHNVAEFTAGAADPMRTRFVQILQ